MSTPPPVLRAKLDDIVHQGLCQIRNVGYEANPSRFREIAAIADALEVIPTFFHRWDEESEPFIRDVLAELERAVPYLGERFQMLLDMPDEEYAAFYLRPHVSPKGDETAAGVTPSAARAA